MKWKKINEACEYNSTRHATIKEPAMIHRHKLSTHHYIYYQIYEGVFLVYFFSINLSKYEPKSNNLFSVQVMTLVPNLGNTLARLIMTLIVRFMWPTWGPCGADRTEVCPILAPWTLLSGDPFYWRIFASPELSILTHWGRLKMAAISQTTFSKAFAWMKMYTFLL